MEQEVMRPRIGAQEVLRAAEIEADAILLAKNIDGVYSADPKVDPSKVRAFSWDGSSLTELAVTVGEEPTGAFGGAKLAQVSPEPGRALVLVDTTSLTEKSQARDYNYLNDLSKLHTPNGGFVWMLGVNTADADMPSPLDLAAGSYGEFFDFAAPADAQAARDAVAALYLSLIHI